MKHEGAQAHIHTHVHYIYIYTWGSQVSSAGIVTTLWSLPRNCGSILAKGRDISLLHSNQNGFGAHSASYPRLLGVIPQNPELEGWYFEQVQLHVK
jgi:hypothetical protein